MKKTIKINKKVFKSINYFLIALPGFILLIRYFTGDLGSNPIQETTQVTGRVALNLLVGTLAVTPFIVFSGMRWISPIRKWLGVSTFIYAFIHLLIFVWWDYGLNLVLIADVLLEKTFAIVGGINFLILTILAVTSTRYWQKKLGRRWKQLHYLVYLSGILAVTHYFFAVKLDHRRPIVFIIIIGILLLLRFKKIKGIISSSGFSNIVPDSIKKIKLSKK